jgi:hypothetical protein
VLRRAFLALFALVLLAPATASADPGFACRGTALRLELAGNPQTLFTAGGGVPCQADSSALTAADGPNLGLDANVLRADTATPSTASARVSGLRLANAAVRADEVNATATARCVDGQPVLEGSANASGLSVAGIEIAGDDVSETVQDAASGLPVGALIHVVSDEQIRSTDTLIVRGAHITILPPGGGTPLADVVLAEARVAAADAPCSSAATAEGARAILQPADGRDLVASAVPSAGAAVDSCSFTLDGAPLAGTYDAGTRECRADATAASTGPHAVTVTVGDSAGHTASDSGSVTFSTIAPTADLLDSDTRAQTALATAPGSTVASCTIGVRAPSELAYTDLPSEPTATGCTAALAAADYPPGEYETRAVVKNAQGATATYTGRIEIPGPAIEITAPGSTAHPGDGVTAQVTPDDGTSLTGCSVEVDSGGAPRMPAATLSGGRCTSALPADLAPGPATVTVRATDSAGETGRSSRDITVLPVASAAIPGVPKRLGDVYLACGSRSVALVDVAVSGKRVKLLGAARSALIGSKVELRKVGAKKVVARATVGKDGTFTATAPLPRKKGKLDRQARYQAKIGTATSAALKLTRRLRFTSVKSANGKVTLAGKATGRFAEKGSQVVIRRRLTCTREAVAGKAEVGRGGRFRAVITLPAGVDPSLYRATIKVKRSSTFTLPRAVAP